MSSQAATLRATAAAKWVVAAELIAIGSAVGSVTGRIISGFAGCRIRTSAAGVDIIEQQTMFCAEGARAAHATTAGTR